MASGNVTIGAADGSNPRFDLVVANNAGTKSVIAGTASTNPVFPTTGLLDGEDRIQYAVLASVYVPANDAEINSNQITDKRTMIRSKANWVNVMDYGAKIDGVTNDRQALVDAFAALPTFGGAIYIPCTGQPLIIDGAGVVFQGKNIWLCFENGIISPIKAGPSFSGGPLLEIKGVQGTGVSDYNNDWAFRGVGCRITNASFRGDSAYVVAASGGADTFTVSGTPWTTNQWAGFYIMIRGGTGAGQMRRIVSNTNNTLTVAPNWNTNPALNSAAVIMQKDARGLKLTWQDDLTLDSVECKFFPAPGLELVSVRESYFGRVHVEECGNWGEQYSQGTVTSGGATTLSDSTRSAQWTTNQWADYYVYITGGANPEQVRRIVSNTTTQLTVEIAWDANPSNETYYIFKPGIALAAGDAIDGNNELHFSQINAIELWGPGLLVYGQTSNFCRNLDFGLLFAHGRTVTPVYVAGATTDHPNILLNNLARSAIFHASGSIWYAGQFMVLGGVKAIDNSIALEAQNGNNNQTGMRIGKGADDNYLDLNFEITGTGTIGLKIDAGVTDTVISEDSVLEGVTPLSDSGTLTFDNRARLPKYELLAWLPASDPAWVAAAGSAVAFAKQGTSPNRYSTWAFDGSVVEELCFEDLVMVPRDISRDAGYDYLSFELTLTPSTNPGASKACTFNMGVANVSEGNALNEARNIGGGVTLDISNMTAGNRKTLTFVYSGDAYVFGDTVRFTVYRNSTYVDDTYTSDMWFCGLAVYYYRDLSK